MKLVVLIIMVSCFLGCSKQFGYVYDKENQMPLEGVLVRDLNNVNQRVITNKDGLFSFTDSGDLIIKKEGYKSDTLQEYGCKPKGKCFDGHIFYMERN